MRVLITGATGLIGSHLTNLLHQKGIAVNYLTTGKEKIQKQENYTGYYWNPDEKEIDTNSFKGVDAIYHLAGATVAKRWTEDYKKEIIESRTKSAAVLYEALQENEHSIKQFISASGINVYPSSLQKLYTEEEPAVDDSFLGEVVERWETAADEFQDLGMKVTKVRIGLVLAEEGGALPKMKIPASYNAGAAFGNGEQWQSWIHIRDVAGIFLHVLQNSLEGVYNAVAPNPVTNEELMEKMAAQLGKNKWLPNVPSFVLKVALGEMSTVLLSSQLVSSEKVQKTGYDFEYKNLPKALEDLL
ncbi:TIGR01777 family protein [Antarcticibacterium flavum]|uniref:TIGR01777 family protein n=1 Tax=Antarcticibacterium flavum TaxID=2058175 RepID=A0A5B7WZW3_9FLAO|nr:MULTISPECIES: TIGR01777 family oxidoreductase [Antarcticibacterium]MCM4160747.1 TIGR01777 family protein [Antarcticibacterium sp. W02-3]QCY68776.1 TIGR01777 family protein [Antarcticibacterium flavum]